MKLIKVEEFMSFIEDNKLCNENVLDALNSFSEHKESLHKQAMRNKYLRRQERVKAERTGERKPRRCVYRWKMYYNNEYVGEFDRYTDLIAYIHKAYGYTAFTYNDIVALTSPSKPAFTRQRVVDKYNIKLDRIKNE